MTDPKLMEITLANMMAESESKALEELEGLLICGIFQPVTFVIIVVIKLAILFSQSKKQQTGNSLIKTTTSGSCNSCTDNGKVDVSVTL